jgi:cysteine desulfurase
MRVYFDHAATTPLAPEVLEAMLPYMTEHFGNPSSIHSYGRTTRSAIEKARKKIADLLGCTAAEIFFTSGGTEADNTALIGSVFANPIQTLITSPIEHHAVLHTAKYLEKIGKVKIHWVKHFSDGTIDLEHFEKLLSQSPQSLVSIMHGNNEIGTLSPIDTIGKLCEQYQAIFHSDCVQTIAHIPLHLYQTPVDYIAASAHKFNGPKGIGILYAKAGSNFYPLLHGGAQERNVRGGTENTAGIIGMAKALELTIENLQSNELKLLSLKKYFINELFNKMPQLLFNGKSNTTDHQLNHIINISLPPSERNEMLLMNLDIAGIAASAGSACTSGTNIGSHVLEALGAKNDWGYVRFSISKNTTKEEINYVINILEKNHKD